MITVPWRTVSVVVINFGIMEINNRLDCELELGVLAIVVLDRRH